MRKILLATAAGFAALVADGATPARAQSAAEVSGQTPAPGITTYVQGRFRFFGGLVDQDGDSTPTGKLANHDLFTYGRIWVGADGVSADGLRYGARLEIRMPGDGVEGDGRGTLFFRRAVGYLGTPTLGQLRFGSGNVSAVEQMFTGHIMGTIASGLLDGDQNLVVGIPMATSFFYSSSTVNNFTAIGYFTPQFFGFDAGISYGANEGSFNALCGAGGATFVACDRASSSADAATATQLRNIIDVMLRYRGTFGPVGIAASGGFRTADTVDAIAPAVAFDRATAGIFGAQLTWAGLTFGGITTFGPYNRGFTALPKTGNNDNAFSWQLGASYRFGAFTVGAAYHELRIEGSTAAVANRRERGFGVGGSYALAPGMALFLEYVHSNVRETGVDQVGAVAGVQDRAKANLGILGISFAW